MGEREKSVHVLSALTEEQSRFAHALVDAARVADAVSPLSEQAVAAIGNGREGPRDGVRHIVSDVGYANILAGREGEPAMIEAVVAPDARRRGHGRALLAAAFAAARELGGDVSPRAWAHGDLPGASALASSLGLSRLRELLQLRVRLTGQFDPLVVDDAVVLRTYAGPADDAEILRVNNAAFDWHPEQGGWSRADIAERTGSSWFDPQGLFLAFDAPETDAPETDAPETDVPETDVPEPDKLLGFHWTKMQSEPGSPDDPGGLGEVYIVGVDPTTQGRGLGRLLTLAGLHYFANRGVAQVMLYVEGDNAAALRTYGRLGFEQYAIDVAYG